MAKKKSEEPIVDIGGAYSKGEEFFNKFKTYIIGFFTALLIVFGISVVYYKFFHEPKVQEASEEIWKAQYYFGVDSLDKAISGTNQYPGFAELATDYSGTPAGETAKYYLGLSYLRRGNYQEAIDILSDVSLDDPIMSVMSIGNIGDAHVELGQTGKGREFYRKAIDAGSIGFTKSYWTFKLAQLEEFENNWQTAYDLYSSIKSDYPEEYEAQSIDKYIARSGAMLQS